MTVGGFPESTEAVAPFKEAPGCQAMSRLLVQQEPAASAEAARKACGTCPGYVGSTILVEIAGEGIDYRQVVTCRF